MALRLENIYLPEIVEITGIRDETPDTKTFDLAFRNKEIEETFTYQPGQFAMISVFGVGEAPFCLSSSPTRKPLQITVRGVGRVTRALHSLKVGDEIGIRAPLGKKGFPVDTEMKGKDILIVGGGLGMAPLRSVLWYLLDHRSDYGEITLLYGARTPHDLLYKGEYKDGEYGGELKEWEEREDLRVLVTVDVGDEGWKAKGKREGVVTLLYEDIKDVINVERTVALVCGPPIMFRFAVKGLLDMGFKPPQIYTTLERRMHCGVGKCKHCCIGDKFVCLDGPVFTYEEIQGFAEEAF